MTIVSYDNNYEHKSFIWYNMTLYDSKLNLSLWNEYPFLIVYIVVIYTWCNTKAHNFISNLRFERLTVKHKMFGPEFNRIFCDLSSLILWSGNLISLKIKRLHTDKSKNPRFTWTNIFWSASILQLCSMYSWYCNQ